MIAFREPLKSGLLAEDSGNIELGEVFDHMRQRNDHSFGIPG